MSNGQAETPSRWQAAEGAAENRGGVPERLTTRWVEETRRYRRPLGGWWWLALLLIPAILALLGGAFGDDAAAKTTSGSSSSTSSSATTGSVTSTTTGATGNLASGVFAVSRTGQDVTVTADVPNDAAKTGLLDAVKAAVPGANVVDQVKVVAGSTGPDATAVKNSVTALAGLGDFGLAYDLKSLTATGTATDDAAKQSATDAITKAWPAGTNPAIGISVGNDTTAACATLGDKIKVVLASTKITFAKNSTEVSADSKPALDKVAKLVTGCKGVKLTVAGYTDKSGSAETNQQLSEGRAKAVVDYLAGAGVDKGSMTAVGKGATDFIASNDTAQGIAANRRVEITVG